MSHPICRLLEQTPPGTLIQELMINGEDVSRVDKFVKYNSFTGLAYFSNESNSVFVAVAEKIDMIEFAFEKCPPAKKYMHTNYKAPFIKPDIARYKCGRV